MHQSVHTIPTAEVVGNLLCISVNFTKSNKTKKFKSIAKNGEKQIKANCIHTKSQMYGTEMRANPAEKLVIPIARVRNVGGY